MISLLGFILVVGIVIIILILLSLISSKTKDHSKRILTLFFTLVLLVNISAYASLYNLRLLNILTFPFDFVIVWLIGPLLLIYIRILYNQKSGVIKNTIHFIPSILLPVLVGLPLTVSFLYPPFNPSYLVFLDRNQSIIMLMRNLYCLGYLCCAIHVFNTFKLHKRLVNESLSKSDFAWIKRLLILSLAFIGLDTAMIACELLIMPLPSYSGFGIMCFIILITVYLAYYGIKHSKILLPEFLTFKKRNQRPIRETPFVIDNKMESTKALFMERMEREKYYTEEDLNLTRLAHYFDMTDKQVSLLLNQYIGQSFHDYINSLRIEEVKRKLISPTHSAYTIVALAFDSGFNSKATFNRIFKKETNMTPSQFRKRNKS